MPTWGAVRSAGVPPTLAPAVRVRAPRGDQFIRRFLSHVLPKGFHRIRHYGLLANGNRAETGETRHTVEEIITTRRRRPRRRQYEYAPPGLPWRRSSPVDHWLPPDGGEHYGTAEVPDGNCNRLQR